MDILKAGLALHNRALYFSLLFLYLSQLLFCIYFCLTKEPTRGVSFPELVIRLYCAVAWLSVWVTRVVVPWSFILPYDASILVRPPWKDAPIEAP